MTSTDRGTLSKGKRISEFLRTYSLVNGGDVPEKRIAPLIREKESTPCHICKDRNHWYSKMGQVVDSIHN